MGKQKKQKTIFQESQTPSKNRKGTRITKTLEKNKKWRLLGGPFIAQDFHFFVFLFVWFFQFFLFWSTNQGKTKEKKQFLETLGWTLYLPRLLETSFLDSSSFCLFLVLVKNLGKTKTFFGDSWMDPLSLKTFRQLFFIFVFCCSKFFLFFFVLVAFGHPRKNTYFSTLWKGGGAQPRLSEYCFSFFFPRFFCFLVRSTGFAGTNCHTLLAGPQAIYSSYKEL